MRVKGKREKGKKEGTEGDRQTDRRTDRQEERGVWVVVCCCLSYSFFAQMHHPRSLSSPTLPSVRTYNTTHTERRREAKVSLSASQPTTQRSAVCELLQNKIK